MDRACQRWHRDESSVKKSARRAHTRHGLVSGMMPYGSGMRRWVIDEVACGSVGAVAGATADGRTGAREDDGATTRELGRRLAEIRDGRLVVRTHTPPQGLEAFWPKLQRAAHKLKLGWMFVAIYECHVPSA